MSDKSTTLPRWAYLSIAIFCAALGIAATTVTGDFFILGLQQMEPDQSVRRALAASGILLIISELVAFGLASLLDKRKHSGLRIKLMILGCSLLAFEVFTIYATQASLIDRDLAKNQGAAGHVQSLQKTIATKTAAAEALMRAGERDTESKHPWVRAAGAQALKDAAKALQEVEASAKELATIQASKSQSTASLFGEAGASLYAVVRSVLMTVVGLVMFAAAGALVRAAQEQGDEAPMAQTTTYRGKEEEMTPEPKDDAPAPQETTTKVKFEAPPEFVVEESVHRPIWADASKPLEQKKPNFSALEARLARSVMRSSSRAKSSSLYAASK